MKQFVETDFDKIYDELNRLNESKDYISLLKNAAKDDAGKFQQKVLNSFWTFDEFIANLPEALKQFSDFFKPYYNYLYNDIFIKANNNARYINKNIKLYAHHIIFKSFCKKELVNDISNLIAVSYEEHIKAHTIFFDCICAIQLDNNNEEITEITDIDLEAIKQIKSNAFIPVKTMTKLATLKDDLEISDEDWLNACLDDAKRLADQARKYGANSGRPENFKDEEGNYIKAKNVYRVIWNTDLWPNAPREPQILVSQQAICDHIEKITGEEVSAKTIIKWNSGARNSWNKYFLAKPELLINNKNSPLGKQKYTGNYICFKIAANHETPDVLDFKVGIKCINQNQVAKCTGNSVVVNELAKKLNTSAQELQLGKLPTHGKINPGGNALQNNLNAWIIIREQDLSVLEALLPYKPEIINYEED